MKRESRERRQRERQEIKGDTGKKRENNREKRGGKGWDSKK